MMYREEDPRVLGVLACALHSSSRATRMRAVAMLARVDCADRMRWLEEACADSDEDVCATALGVASWVIEPAEPPWPQREDPSFDRVPRPRHDAAPQSETEPASRWQWEYVVEIWRDDGMLVGAYLAATCQEDDEHARRIALGQAILANAAGRGDAFDASTAAAFIVGKRRLPGCADAPGRRSRGKGQNGIA
jgi:hypothetical protein